MQNKIIVRNKTEEVSDNLNKLGSELDNCVDFGATMMDWFLNTDYSPHQVVIIANYLDLLEMLDGISILTKNGSLQPSIPLLRTMFEVYLTIKYILQDDSENRAKTYEVYHFIRRLESLKLRDANSRPSKELENILRKEHYNELADNIPFMSHDTLQEQHTAIEGDLNSEEFKAIYDKWQSVGRKNRKHWYSLFNGPDCLEQLAIKVGCHGKYKILYKTWSIVCHSNSALDRLKIDKDRNWTIATLRSENDFSWVTSFATSMMLDSTIDMINALFPEKIGEFTVWYYKSIYRVIPGLVQL